MFRNLSFSLSLYLFRRCSFSEERRGAFGCIVEIVTSYQIAWCIIRVAGRHRISQGAYASPPHGKNLPHAETPTRRSTRPSLQGSRRYLYRVQPRQAPPSLSRVNNLTNSATRWWTCRVRDNRGKTCLMPTWRGIGGDSAYAFSAKYRRWFRDIKGREGGRFLTVYCFPFSLNDDKQENV